MPSSTKGMPTAMEMRRELRGAVRCLTERGITKAAKWAAEQLCGLPDNLVGSENDDGHELGLLGREEPPASDRYLLAKTYFDLREYKRAASTLEHECDARSTFLRCYAKYLAGERAREEQTLEGEGEPKNEELEGIEREIKACDRPDAFLLYLQGLVLLDKERKSEAKEALLLSVRSYPCNWAAWQALQEVQDADGCPAEGSLPDHWMSNFFAAAVCLENGDENERGLEEYTRLQHLFPKSEYVLAQAATAHYNLRQFDEAQDLFESLHRRSPHRIESMDTYSNILYVKEAYAGLSHLAHSAILTDKYKPETCCIIGNYYSLRTQHEKAVAYFRRALKLNRNYLSAWTLMGHEYVEMKNPEAAIEAYRRAVDINPRDYRAWYGLGQTYEVLRMPYYALYYFRQATKLRPGDARFWCAMGQCYESEELNMQDAALQCYKNAESKGDREGIALAKIADLYRKRGDYEAAYTYNKRNIERLDADGVCNADVVQTLMFLTQHCKGTGRLGESEVYCSRLLDYGGNHREDAKSLLKEIRLLRIHSEEGGGGGGNAESDEDDGGMSMSESD